VKIAALDDVHGMPWTLDAFPREEAARRLEGG
jgi:hypothetical protein